MNVKYIIGLLFALGMAGCIECEVPEPSHPTRTVLVYMAAENNLDGYTGGNIVNMLKGVEDGNLNDGHLLVFYDGRTGEPPTLSEITLNPSGKGEEVVVKTYEELNSVDPSVMRSIINDVTTNPAYKADSYGLILWSHGTAWLPSTYKNMLKSFGQDGSNWMEITGLAAAIPDNVFDFILFDACYMASVEVAYELRNKADYIVASPVETLATGFPYNLIIKPMFASTLDLETVCNSFYEYYDAQTGWSRSASVSLTETKHLDELMAVTRSILGGKAADVYTMPTGSIQKNDLLTSSTMLYDFDDFIEHFASSEDYITFMAALDKAVIYKQTTPNATFTNGIIHDINKKFSGLSAYIPRANYLSLNDWYFESCSWAKDVYAEQAAIPVPDGR